MDECGPEPVSHTNNNNPNDQQRSQLFPSRTPLHMMFALIFFSLLLLSEQMKCVLSFPIMILCMSSSSIGIRSLTHKMKQLA